MFIILFPVIETHIFVAQYRIPRFTILVSSCCCCSQHVEKAAMMKTTHSRKSRVVLRFVLHTSQCGSLIGKAGTKIKEIREV